MTLICYRVSIIKVCTLCYLTLPNFDLPQLLYPLNLTYFIVLCQETTLQVTIIVRRGMLENIVSVCLQDV